MHRTFTVASGLFLLVAVAAFGACSSGSGGDDEFGEDGAHDGAAVDTEGSSGSDGERMADAGAAPPAGESANQLTMGQRKVIFETELEIAAEDVEARYHEVSAIARQMGGYAADSRLTAQTANGDQPRARVTVRVPSERREDALDRLRGMEGIEVTLEHTTSSEVTDEYTDLSSRLRNLQRSELRYLDLMDHAETVSDILAVGERLDGVRSQIEQIQGRLNVLDDLVDFATIGIVLVATDDSAAGTGEDPAFVTAWKDAWGSVGSLGEQLVAGAAWASVGIILLAPLAIVAGGIRVVSQRRAKPAA